MSLIGRFEHLPNRPRSDEARPLLEKIASQVKPIMTKRGWKVGTLAEFLPSNPALLGLNTNAGERINLRLRPPGDTTTFYDFDQLALVMLHELTHNEHGPHNAQFYKLLAELEEEFYELKRKGFSGEGFHSKGNHLSGFKVPEHVGRAKGLEAAQKRLDVQKKIGRGGVLGGSDYRGRSMKEVLAEAAERRIRDDKICPTSSGPSQEAQEEARRAHEESVGIDAADIALHPGSAESQDQVIKSDDDDIVEVVNPALAKGPSAPIKSSTTLPRDLPADGSRKAPKSAGLRNGPTSSAISAASKHKTETRPSPSDRLPSGNSRTTQRAALNTEGWSCPTCTLINQPQSLSCEVCTTARPTPNGMSNGVWYCGFCNAGPRDKEFWTCGECGWVRNFG